MRAISIVSFCSGAVHTLSRIFHLRLTKPSLHPNDFWYDSLDAPVVGKLIDHYGVTFQVHTRVKPNEVTRQHHSGVAGKIYRTGNLCTMVAPPLAQTQFYGLHKATRKLGQ
jgi:hypothetical protein